MDFIYITTEEFIYEAGPFSSPGLISGYSFDGNNFDFIAGSPTVVINVSGESSSAST